MDLKRNKIIWLLIGTFLLLNTSCKYFVTKDEAVKDEQGKTIARVGETYLYEEDLKGLMSKSSEFEDSAKIAQHYVESWIKRQLLLELAEANSSMSESDLKKKVDDYRYQLIVYEYQKKYIKEKLNDQVSNQEIEQYYENNKDNFQLKENIVRCHFLQIPKGVSSINKAKGWFRSSQQKNYDKLKVFGKEYAVKQSYEDSVWYRFDDVVTNTPLQSIPNKTNYLRHHKNIEATDSHYVYLLKINEYKISNEISPLEFVKDEIRNIIVNKRKTTLIRELEQGIYNNAKKNKSFEIHTNIQ